MATVQYLRMLFVEITGLGAAKFFFANTRYHSGCMLWDMISYDFPIPFKYQPM